MTLLTVRTIIASRNPLDVTCNGCLHNQNVDLDALERAGCGDTPLVDLWFRCSRCSSPDTFALVMGAGHGYTTERPKNQF